jgi:hypothetical protein
MVRHIAGFDGIAQQWRCKTMFRALDEILAQWWIVVLGIWFVVLVALRVGVPAFDDLAQGGEFLFLPEDMASRNAELSFQNAFPDRKTTSNIVIVFSREEPGGLMDADRDFIEETLKPVLEQIRDRVNSSSIAVRRRPAGLSIGVIDAISGILTEADPGMGELLVSRDRKASLVAISKEFTSWSSVASP